MTVARLHGRLAALLALVALVAAMMAQRFDSVRCAMTGALHWAACCQVAAGSDEGPSFDEPACCEHLDHPALMAAPAAAPAVPVGLALLPAAVALAAPPWAVRPARSRRHEALLSARGPPARAGPRPPPSLARRLATLSVLLT